MTDAEIEIVSQVIGDLLTLVSSEKREAILVLTSANEEAKRKKHEECGGIYSAAEFTNDFKNSPRLRYWNDIMNFKARVICTFVRNISNSHSPEDAAHILFSYQRRVPGSGYLEDYIGKLLPRK